MTTQRPSRLSLGTLFLEGFFILLPFLIAYLMLGQLFDMLMALTQPILDVMPERFVPGPWAHRFAAAGILIALCFLVGMAARTVSARRFGRWFERRSLEHFPPLQGVEEPLHVDLGQGRFRTPPTRSSRGHARHAHARRHRRGASQRSGHGLRAPGTDPRHRLPANPPP